MRYRKLKGVDKKVLISRGRKRRHRVVGTSIVKQAISGKVRLPLKMKRSCKTTAME